MPAAKVKVIDRGLNRIIRQTNKAGRLKIKVGIQGSEGQAVEHEGAGLTNAQLGVIHEFGTKGVSLGRSGAETGGIPERSFIRSTFDREVKKWQNLMIRSAKEIYGPNRPNIRKVLGLVGEKAVADIRQTINKGIPPELMPETVERKGSSKPLIDTGQLKASITYKVVK
jgi:hypothetical protein